MFVGSFTGQEGWQGKMRPLSDMPQGFKDAVARRMANVGRHLSPEVEVILLHKESLFQALIVVLNIR